MSNTNILPKKAAAEDADIEYCCDCPKCGGNTYYVGHKIVCLCCDFKVDWGFVK